MGVEIQIESGLVEVRVSGRVDAASTKSDWIDKIRAKAEAEGAPVCLLSVFEPGFHLPISILAAGSRQMISVAPYVRAAAVVVSGEHERATLRACRLAVGPSYQVEMFSDEASARAWLLAQRPSPSRTVAGHDFLRAHHEGVLSMPLELAPRS